MTIQTDYRALIAARYGRRGVDWKAAIAKAAGVAACDWRHGLAILAGSGEGVDWR